MSVTILDEYDGDGGRLGRHVHHDPKSRRFDLADELERRSPSLAQTLRPWSWQRRAPVYDQGNLGSCVGNALAGCASTDDAVGRARRLLGERDAVTIYERATTVDDIDGAYPPDDTGTTGLAGAKAAKALDLSTSYKWAFDIQTTLATIAWVGPVAVGVNWYDGFDQPGDRGLVSISGSIRGGHEFQVLGINPDSGNVLAVNSWGPGWGWNGYFRFSITDLERLLAESGDVVALVP